MREKVVKYMYNPEVQKIKGLQRHSYYNELTRHDAGAFDVASKWTEMKLGMNQSLIIICSHKLQFIIFQTIKISYFYRP